MDVLLYCLEMEDMMDYETLKATSRRKEKNPVERSYSHNVSVEHSDDKSPEQVQKKRKPIARSSTVEGVKGAGSKPIKDASLNVPFVSQPRYHPYEEVYIPPKLNSKPQVKPPIAQKPVQDPSNRKSSVAPTPVPRRTVLVKQPVVTDL